MIIVSYKYSFHIQCHRVLGCTRDKLTVYTKRTLGVKFFGLSKKYPAILNQYPTRFNFDVCHSNTSHSDKHTHTHTHARTHARTHTHTHTHVHTHTHTHTQRSVYQLLFSILSSVQIIVNIIISASSSYAKVGIAFQLHANKTSRDLALLMNGVFTQLGSSLGHWVPSCSSAWCTTPVCSNNQTRVVLEDRYGILPLAYKTV